MEPPSHRFCREVSSPFGSPPQHSQSDQVPISDDLLIHIIRSGIDQVIFDRKKARGFFPLQNSSRGEHPTRVTDGRNHLSFLMCLSDNPYHLRITPHQVRSVPSR